MARNDSVVLFEPWHMGDAIIAYAIALQDPSRLSLACNPRWHGLLQIISEGMKPPGLFSVELPYIGKKKPKLWERTVAPEIAACGKVISIRGDIRDYFASRQSFPSAKRRFNGWTAFAARKFAVVDFPFARGWLPITNRYRAWASLAGVEWEKVEAFYLSEQQLKSRPRILIHVGAQWRSRQYPHVAELAAVLRKGAEVRVVAAPGDFLPDGIKESEVARAVDGELVELFKAASLVIANDSGPMHLAALLRCRTAVVCRVSAIEQWIPPTAIAVKSPEAPRGYMPDPAYESEEIIRGWPGVQEVSAAIR